MDLTLSRANVIIEGALAKGAELGLAPLSVAVLDPGAHLIAFQRQDGSSNLRPQIAVGKAGGALALGVSSRTIAAMAVDRPVFVSSLGSFAPQGIVPAAGGVLVFDQGRLVGAVGVTGDSSDNDEACAFAGVAAVGLSTEP